VTDNGRPFASPAAFGKQVCRLCIDADLKPVLCDDGRTREAACKQLAHAGCSAPEIMAVSGHNTLSQVQVYIDEVEQERMATAAMVKLAAATAIKPEQESG